MIPSISRDVCSAVICQLWIEPQILVIQYQQNSITPGPTVYTCLYLYVYIGWPSCIRCSVPSTRAVLYCSLSASSPRAVLNSPSTSCVGWTAYQCFRCSQHIDQVNLKVNQYHYMKWIIFVWNNPIFLLWKKNAASYPLLTFAKFAVSKVERMERRHQCCCFQI